MSLNDTFIVIPLFPDPGAVLLRHARAHVVGPAGPDDGVPGLGLRRAADPLGGDEPAHREFTETGIFSGMSTRQILVEEHLPYVLPIVFSTTMNNINWSIGLEVTLSVLGFTDINTPTIGVLIYWANQHTALVAGIWWWIFFPVLLVVDDLHRALPAGRVDERAHRPAQPPRPDRRDERAGPRRLGPARLLPDVRVRRRARGPRRRRCQPQHRGQRDLRPRRQIEQRQDHADQDHRRRDPAAARGAGRLGGVQLLATGASTCTASSRAELARDPLEAPLLHHAGLDERAEPGAAGAALLRRLRLPPHRQADAGSSSRSCAAICSACISRRTCSTPIRTSSRAACASGSPSRSPPSAGPNSSSPTSRPRRSTSSSRRACWR